MSFWRPILPWCQELVPLRPTAYGCCRLAGISLHPHLSSKRPIFGERCIVMLPQINHRKVHGLLPDDQEFRKEAVCPFPRLGPHIEVSEDAQNSWGNLKTNRWQKKQAP